MDLPYNPSDKASIIKFAKLLKDKTLRILCHESILAHGYTGKGNFGQILEKFYFLYEPNSDAEPDFAEAGLELKTSPLYQLKNKQYRSKERLVLNIINYFEVVEQEFESSSFWKKNTHLLLIFYLFKADTDILDRVIKLVDEWSFSSVDQEIIKKDWEMIKQKIREGKAHELSEGDTFYLGACTKGANANSKRKQPYSVEPAMQRAYSLKQGYVNHIIATIAKGEKEKFGKVIPSLIAAKEKSIEEIVIEKFAPYYGCTIQEIMDSTGLELNRKAKSFYASLTKAILGVDKVKEIEEFSKANIVRRTVRLKKNGLPKESISFTAFKYEDIIEEDWENAPVNELLERKFLFIFFQFEGDGLVLRKAKFWNMPYADRQEVKKVWERTKQLVMEGKIVENMEKDKRQTFFPNKTFNTVAHVRPHARNSKDTYPLPVTDIFTQENAYTKHSFWLNDTYVRDAIYLKDN